MVGNPATVAFSTLGQGLKLLYLVLTIINLYIAWRSVTKSVGHIITGVESWNKYPLYLLSVW